MTHRTTFTRIRFTILAAITREILAYFTGFASVIYIIICVYHFILVFCFIMAKYMVVMDTLFARFLVNKIEQQSF